MNTKDKGDLSELKVITALKEQGYPVLTPFGDNLRYDLIYEDDTFIRVQVKTGVYDNGKVRFKTHNMGHNNEGNYQKSYTEDEIDQFMVYCPKNDEIYQVPVEDAGSSCMALRVEEAERNHPNINWAEEYRFSNGA